MAAAAHNATFAKKAGVPQSVAHEYNEADSAKRKRGYAAALKRKRKMNSNGYGS
jgi:ribosomal protein S21